MRSRSRDHLLRLAIVSVVIVVAALFTLPWVYIAVLGTGNTGQTAFWTAGVEIAILGVAAVCGIIAILNE